jgi:DNA polymerase delta subunit 1
LIQKAFQQLDIDYIIGSARQDLPGAKPYSAPIIRIFGVTVTTPSPPILNPAHGLTPQAEGNSVLTYVHGYEPYFFVQAPKEFGPDDLEPFRAELNVRWGGGGG